MDRYSTLREGLVGAWCPSLRTGGYTLEDRSGQNNHGTLTNMDGQNNWQAAALNFDASDDYVGLGTLKWMRFNDNPWSITGWIFPRSASTWRTVISRWDGNNTNNRQFSVLINGGFGPPTGGLSFFTNRLANGSLGTNALAVNQWYFFCATHFGNSTTANNLFVYSPQRGVEPVTRYGTGGGVDADFGTNQIWIGRSQDNTATFDGLIDDVRIYYRVLTASEMWLLASSRGVGLTPTRHRRGNVIGSRFHLNVGGTWKAATPWVKVNGVWTKATPKVRVSGAYK